MTTNNTTIYTLTESDIEYLKIIHKMKEKGLVFDLIKAENLMIMHSKAKEKDNS